MVLLFILASCRHCSFQSVFVGLLSSLVRFRAFSLAFFCLLLLLVFLLCAVFHKAPFNLNASFGVFSYTLYPVLFVVLFWLAFPSVSLLLVSFSGVVHMSQPVAG